MSANQTVGQVVKIFFILFGGGEQDLDSVVERVCSEWGCKPDDDGERLYAQLLMRLKNPTACTSMCFGGHGARVQESDPDKPYSDFSMNWHEVGPGTDPNRFLNQADERALRHSSVAMREHYGL